MPILMFIKNQQNFTDWLINKVENQCFLLCFFFIKSTMAHSQSQLPLIFKLISQTSSQQPYKKCFPRMLPCKRNLTTTDLLIFGCEQEKQCRSSSFSPNYTEKNTWSKCKSKIITFFFINFPKGIYLNQCQKHRAIIFIF